MSERIPNRWRKRCRRFLRGVRISLVLLLFFVVAAGVYLNEVGLPGFLKTPLLKKLHERGLDLQFSRLRWHLNRGFVAENVRFERATATPSDPRLSVKEVELKVDHAALVKFQLMVNTLILRGGELNWLVGETNGQPVGLSMTNIQTQLRFLPGDQWQLDHFTASFGGARLHFSGTVINASALRDWKLFQGGAEQPELGRKRLREFADTLKRIQFFKPPELFLVLDGNARDPQSFQGLLTLNALDARTPWGSLTNGTLVARLTAPDATNRVANVAVELQAADAATPWGSLTNGVLVARLTAPDLTNYGAHVAFELRAADANTPWGAVKTFQLTMRGVRDEINTNVIRAVLEMQADHFTTEWAQASNAHVTIRWTHSLTNAIPLDGIAEASLTAIQTHWASAGELDLTARMATPAASGPLRADESWAWWAKLEPYSLAWNCELKGIHSPDFAQTNDENFELKELNFGGMWRAPDLTVTNLYAELYGGKFSLQAAMNIATRAITFNWASDFDVQKVAPFFPEESRDWFTKFSWENPPEASCAGGVMLPAWTNRQPDWKGEVLPSLWMRGEFKVENAAVLEIPISSAQTHFARTNAVWDFPDVVVTRPEGTVEAALKSDDQTRDFYSRVKSSIDPKIVRSLLDAGAQKGMDDFIFTAPPKVEAEIRGRWHDPKSLWFKGHIAITNLTFRGETASYFKADFDYTNQFMNLLNGRVERGSRYMTASGLGVDFPANKLYLTNGFSIMEATPVAHAISRKVTETIAPYQFLQPPTVHAHGTIPLVDEVPADLHFQVDGGPFHWLKFNVEHVTGEVNWVGDHMTVTNAQASFYKGNLTGSAAFAFDVEPGTDFAFDVNVTNTDLHALMSDLQTATNRLEGLLSGHLNITHANSDDWKSWSGGGNAILRDGLIWDIPIFGGFSRFLDGVHAGLGESRASEASARFTIASSVIHSDTLELRSPTFRLVYHGNVDFDGKVDANMDAEVFHDVPLIGGIISTALTPISKLFQFKVTGTLDDPKIEQRFAISRAILAPFHPFRTLNEMFTSPTNTYTAPVFEPPPKAP